MVYEDRSGRLWGTFSADDAVPRQIISEWLYEQRLPWSSISTSDPPPTFGKPRVSSSAVETYTPSPPAVDPTGRVALASGGVSVRNKELTPVELFETVASAMWVVQAERMSGGRFQGSAVVVSPDYLLTNCHVVNGAASITLTHKETSFRATLVSANIGADRCILRSDRKLESVAPIREYSALKVGERVYSIGAPFGLELTLSDGLLSGKRTHAGVRLVQTSAPISSGSSGGGLFDAYGNLVGISTFLLKDSQNLNFAIAAEDYVERH